MICAINSAFHVKKIFFVHLNFVLVQELVSFPPEIDFWLCVCCRANKWGAVQLKSFLTPANQFNIKKIHFVHLKLIS